MSAATALAPVAAGLLAAFVGFASSFAVVLAGFTAVGASPAEAASGLLAVSVAMGLGGIVMSLRTRMPISIAWSTPGSALLAGGAAPEGGFAAAVGAFLVSGALIAGAGLWRPLGRAVAAIPPALANAMLAGVLLPLCLAPVAAVAGMPALALPVVIAWAVMAKLNRLLAVPAAVLLAVALVAATATLPPGLIAGSIMPAPVLVVPEFRPAALIGIALPLFIVTMASQNIPGIAVLNANGYRPEPGPLFTATGIFTVLAAPFGAHAVNLAAITAAICAGPEAHPDPARRWPAALVAGAGYVVLGLGAGAAAAFVAAAPPVLIQAVAGLALLGAFGSALMAAVQGPGEREAAVVCFLVAAGGLTLFGIGGAFWGLLAGLALRVLARWRGA
ncbi:MAG: benzoate/H(+) symporter BenE family transporter [Acetobacteraceae bacterium]|nr:benzoate/H(+) symporter BenE family transporter [Acetobacteraceae bacterium]